MKALLDRRYEVVASVTVAKIDSVHAGQHATASVVVCWRELGDLDDGMSKAWLLQGLTRSLDDGQSKTWRKHYWYGNMYWQWSVHERWQIRQ
jgi:hypothetical protein